MAHAHRLLRACIATTPGLRLVYGRRYKWMKTRFMPALELASSSVNSATSELVAMAWDLSSGIHSLNNAWSPALRAGITAVQYSPQNEAIVTNYAELCQEAGFGEVSETVLERFLDVRPTSEYATSLLQQVREEHSKALSPLYGQESLTVQVNECLADDRFAPAINILRGRRSVEAILARARVYGATEDTESAMLEWRKIERSRAARISLSPADWFYLADELSDSIAFWKIMLSIAPRLYMTSAPIHESLAKSPNLRSPDILELMFRFNIARTSKNALAMQLLSKQYPIWKEAHRWAQWLHARA